MKKIVLTAMVLFASVASYAQQAVGTFTLQPKVGVVGANFSGKNVNTDMKVGFIGGVEAEYQITDMVSVAAGALYSMQGAKADNLKFNLDYINVPVVANVYVVPGLAVKLGAQFGFKTSSKIKYDTKVTDDLEGDVNVKGFDFSIPVGLSYEYKNVVLDGRYNLGLTKVADGDKVKNSVFQITLGYKFAL